MPSTDDERRDDEEREEEPAEYPVEESEQRDPNGPGEDDEEEEEDPPMIVLRDVVKVYGERTVLDHVGFTAPRRSVTAIIGSSGGGKSTLLKTLIGAIKPDSGEVIVDGANLVPMTERDLKPIRKRMGMLFQNVALFGDLTVGENVALPIREHTDLDDTVVGIMVRMKLDQVGLSDFEGLYPRELSGGMQKRVGIARAIALDPKVVFFDEPTAGLDPVMSGVINKLIVDLTRLLGITSIVVTHSMDGARTVGDQVVLLYGGKIYFAGSPEELETCEDPLVRQFLRGDPEGPIPMRKSAEEYMKTLMG